MRRLASARRFAFALVAGLGGLLAFQACTPKPKITITSPPHGTFTLDASVVVTGTIANLAVANAEVYVNDTLATLNSDQTWSVVVDLDTEEIMHGLEADLRNVSQNRIVARDRILVHWGQSRADGDFSAQSVAMRLADTGLDQIEPLIEDGVNLDLAQLLQPGTVVISGYCAIPGPFGSCLGRVTARVDDDPAPSTTGFTIDVDSQTNYAFGDIDVFDMSIDLDLDGSGLAPDCGWHFEADVTQITGDYALRRDAVQHDNIDVNLTSTPGVSFVGFDDDPTYGLCDFPLLGDLIQLIIGDLQPTVRDALVAFLADPDGGGPADGPVANAIEVALADISITGPLSESLGVLFEAPLFETPTWDGVGEDPDGLTLGSDARITSSVGASPGQCTPPEGSPDLAASYHVDETFPSFGTETPAQHQPYDLGLAISTSAFNQLLKAQVECGLLRTSITEVDLGEGPMVLNAGVLALLIPEFAQLAPDTPMRIDLLPTLAPLLSGQAGPGGEIGELQIPHLIAEVRSDTNSLFLRVAFDFKAGLGLGFDEATGSLLFSLESVAAQDITVSILRNTLGTNETYLQFALPIALEPVLPTLGEGLGAFPLPEFLGLQLSLVELARNGQFYSLFTDLVP